MALAQAEQHALVCAAQETLSGVYQERFHLSCREKKLSEKSLLQSWLTGDAGNLQDKLKSGESLTMQEYCARVEHFDVTHRVPGLERVHKFVSRTAFQEEDAICWR